MWSSLRPPRCFELCSYRYFLIFAILVPHTVSLMESKDKGNFRLGSDIDLAVMDTNVAPETISRLTHDFGDSSLPYFVDVVHFPSLTEQSLREHIERAGRLFYQQTTFAA